MKQKKMCIGRESNPGRPRGRWAFYHWTTDAYISNFINVDSQHLLDCPYKLLMFRSDIIVNFKKDVIWRQTYDTFLHVSIDTFFILKKLTGKAQWFTSWLQSAMDLPVLPLRSVSPQRN